jgi:hypothetical protein
MTTLPADTGQSGRPETAARVFTGDVVAREAAEPMRMPEKEGQVLEEIPAHVREHDSESERSREPPGGGIVHHVSGICHQGQRSGPQADTGFNAGKDQREQGRQAQRRRAVVWALLVSVVVAHRDSRVEAQSDSEKVWRCHATPAAARVRPPRICCPSCGTLELLILSHRESGTTCRQSSPRSGRRRPVSDACPARRDS